MRGQAFVVFKTKKQMEIAFENLQNFQFFGKPLQIERAKNLSKVCLHVKGIIEKKTIKDIKKIKFQLFEKQDNKKENDHSRRLYVKNFPIDQGQTLFEYIFKQYAGFEKAELLENGEGLVTFIEDYYAELAQKQMNGFQISDNNILDVSFAKN